jgi:hypothetical protein
MVASTFAEKYCAQHGLAPEEFLEAAFRRSLYPHARLLRPLLALNFNYFAADREFIRGIGRLTRFRDFVTEVQDFRDDSNNRGFLRRVLRLRVSVTRARRLVQRTMPEVAKRPSDAT